VSQAAFWESIAVPDIRLQAASLARRLSAQAHSAVQRADLLVTVDEPVAAPTPPAVFAEA
jgi:hypothetical protein